MWKQLLYNLANTLDVPPNMARKYAVLILIAMLFLLIKAGLYYYPSNIPNLEMTYKPDLVNESTQTHLSSNADTSIPKEITKSDLNLADSLILAKSGLFPSKIHRLLVYRSKAGYFSDWNHVAKLYGFTSKDIYRLNSHFYIGEPRAISNKQKIKAQPYLLKDTIRVKKYPSKKELRFELNTVDSLTLIHVKGVGPYTAHKFLRFRKALGGFINKKQLYEIKGVDTLVAHYLAENMDLDTSKVMKISLYTEDVILWSKHPYISSKQARMIKAYVDTHRPLASIQELKAIRAIEPSDIEKMLPYFQLK